MNLRIWPPLSGLGALFGNLASIWPTEHFDVPSDRERPETAASRHHGSDDTEQRLPVRDDAFYWAFMQTHL